MDRAARVLGVGAAVLFLAALLFMFLPNRGTALVDFHPPDTEITGQVDCGSPFHSTEWSSDDGCEGPYLGRAGLVIFLLLVMLLCAVAGIALWVFSQRPGRPRPTG